MNFLLSLLYFNRIVSTNLSGHCVGIVVTIALVFIAFNKFLLCLKLLFSFKIVDELHIFSKLLINIRNSG